MRAPFAPRDAATTSGAPTRRSRATVLRLVGLFVVAALLLGLLVFRLVAAQRAVQHSVVVTTHAGVAPLAPDFSLQPLVWPGAPRPSVQALQLSSFHGHPVVLNFWASWCTACQAEAPTFEAAWKAYAARGIVFLGIDVQDSNQDATAFLRRYGITYLNGQDATDTTLVNYGVTALPTTVVITADGRIASKHIGEMTAASLDSAIAPVLRASQRAARATPARALAGARAWRRMT